MDALRDRKWLIISLILLPILILAIFLVFLLNQEQSREKTIKKDEAITTVEDFSGDFSDIPDPQVKVTPGRLTENDTINPYQEDITNSTTNTTDKETVEETINEESIVNTTTSNTTVATPPETPKIVQGPPTLGKSSTVSFDLQGSGNLRCLLRGEERACSGTVTYKNLPDGSYRFLVWGENASGESEKVAYSFTIDSKVLPVTIKKSPKAISQDKNPLFAFAGEKGARFFCKLGKATREGTSFKSCASPRQYRNLADGSYAFSVYQEDRAGNKSKNKRISFAIDIEAPPSATLLSATVSGSDVTAVFQDDGYQIYCALAPLGVEARQTLCQEINVFQGLAPGDYLLSYYQKDAAGNISLAESYNITVPALIGARKRSQSPGTRGLLPGESFSADTAVAVASAIQLDTTRTSDFSESVGATALENLDTGADLVDIAFQRQLGLRSNATWSADLEVTPLLGSNGGSVLFNDTVGDASGNPNGNNLYQDANLSAASGVDWSTRAGNYSGTAAITASNSY